jgi:hypothetical protein
MQKSKLALFRLVVATTALVLSVGCKSASKKDKPAEFRPFRWDIQVEVSKEVTRFVEVHIIGASADLASKLTNITNVGDYLRSKSASIAGLRKDAKAKTKVLKFPNGGQDPRQVIGRTDKIWDTWRDSRAQSLIIMASLPSGDDRKVLPFDSKSPLYDKEIRRKKAFRVVLFRGYVEAPVSPERPARTDPAREP